MGYSDGGQFRDVWPIPNMSTFPMITIEGMHFSGESVELDGNHFINCTFSNCILEYRGGPVAFDRTQMDGCRHVFFGRARRTLHYLQGVGLMPFQPSDWGEFPEQVQ